MVDADNSYKHRKVRRDDAFFDIIKFRGVCAAWGGIATVCGGDNVDSSPP